MFLILRSSISAQLVSLPPPKWLSELYIRNAIKTASPEPLIQIQYNFTEMFLIMPSSKIAQMIPLHRIKGPPELR